MQIAKLLKAKSPIVALVFFAIVISACAQEKAKQMIPGPSVRELVPASQSPNQDGVSQITFGQLFKPGPTEYTQVGTSALKNAPSFPTGYTLYKDRVYEVKTEAVMTPALNTIVFNVPSVENDEEFKNIAILHLEDDEMSPTGHSWSDLTVTTGGWDKDLLPFVTKTQYESLLPDFKSRHIGAITNEFGLFALALTSRSQATSTEPFSQFDVILPSSSDKAQADQEITQKFTIKNNGPRAAAEVSFKEELNGYLDYVSATADGGRCKQSTQSSNRVLCYFAGLPVGASATITVTSRLGRNVVWAKSEMDLGNIIEVVFKEKTTDFADANTQFTTQFNTKVVKVVK